MSSPVAFKMNTDTFSKTLKKMRDKAPTAAALVVDNITEKILKEVIKRSPKNTGKYSRGWKIEKVDKTKRKIIHPNKQLVSILEFTGSDGAHIKGDPLHFVVDGKDVFVKFSNPKGFRPIPHMRPAIKKVKQEAKATIKKLWTDHNPVFRQ